MIPYLQFFSALSNDPNCAALQGISTMDRRAHVSIHMFLVLFPDAAQCLKQDT